MMSLTSRQQFHSIPYQHMHADRYSHMIHYALEKHKSKALYLHAEWIYYTTRRRSSILLYTYFLDSLPSCASSADS